MVYNCPIGELLLNIFTLTCILAFASISTAAYPLELVEEGESTWPPDSTEYNSAEVIQKRLVNSPGKVRLDMMRSNQAMDQG